MTMGQTKQETVVSFTSMDKGTKEDYELLERYEQEFMAETANRVLKHLAGLEHSLSGYQVSRLEQRFHHAVDLTFENECSGSAFDL